MRRTFLALWMSWLLVGLPWSSHARVIELGRAEIQADTGPAYPVTLPVSTAQLPATPARLRARIAFDLPVDLDPGMGQQAIYLAHLYDGGQIELNSMPIAAVPESDTRQHVRWRRPVLIPLPNGLLRAHGNQLVIDAPVPSPRQPAYIARPAVGPLIELLPRAETREFWVQGSTRIIFVVSLLFSAGMLLAWHLRRSETLYGLFGLASLFWSLRTVTFLVDVVPTAYWVPWRMLHHFTMIGSATLVALFSLRLAQITQPRLERAMLAFTVLVPALIGVSAGRLDGWLGQVAGLISLFGIGGVALGAAVLAAWRQRRPPAYIVLAAYGLLLLAAAHDYLMFWHAAWLHAHWPTWVEHSPLLLRYAVSVLLLTFALILLHRFISTLDQIEELNRSLEERVAARETQLAQNFSQLARLEREHAATEERQRIMRDMHDGLGSQLFVALSRVQRGALTQHEMADTLRTCVADMRLALEVLAPSDGDFASAFGDFRHRWSAQLQAAGLNATWQLDLGATPLQLTPHVQLQLLRLLQEALTNVLKHAQASHVTVRARLSRTAMQLEVEDNGRGFPADTPGPDGIHHPSGAGRGLKNMLARAQNIGAALTFHAGPGRTRVCIALPLAPGPPSKIPCLRDTAGHDASLH